MVRSEAKENSSDELTLSASAISTFLSCPYKYKMRYRDRLEPVFGHPALERGTAIHEAVQAWWAGDDMLPKLQEWYERQKDSLLPGEWDEFAKDYAHVSELLRMYREYYGEKMPDDLVVAGTEVEVNARVTQGLRLRGFVDLVVTMDSELWAVEIKTARDLKRRMSYLQWDQQPVIYTWALRGQGLPVEGVMWDGIKTYPYKKLGEQPGSKLFKRVYVRPSDTQIAEFLRNTELVADMIHQADEGGGYPRNLGGACLSCPFKVPCHAEVDGQRVKAEASKRTHFKRRESKA